MTNKQINIAIAEACGWQFIPEYYHGDDQPPEYTTVTPHGERLCGYYPEYCNDLNAMHEAESRFKTATDQLLYAAKILWVRGQGDLFEGNDLNVDHCWIAAIATARERAEAFLRTVGKWEDSES